MPEGDANGAVPAYVGLGSNLGDPVRQVETAVTALSRLPLSRLVARSALFWSEPIGPPGQPRYVNGVVCLETRLTADALLQQLQGIERQQGRIRNVRWGPRTLDLDLLVFGDLAIDTPGLTLPHPRLQERAFVLVPLMEIAPALCIPGLGAVEDLGRAIDASGLEKISGEAHAG